MERILSWIIKHKLLTFLFVIAIFFVPLLIIHILFICHTEMEWLVARWSPGDLMGYVAGFEAFIGTVALGALSLWQNRQIHNQHIESLEPILSMKLISINGILYLMIENTGESGAKNIRITIERIENNGQCDLLPDPLFNNSFELYPHETVQGKVAINGQSVVTETFPKLFVHISYIRSDINKKREYDRTVIFYNGYSQKIIADVNMDNRQIASDVDCIARAVVRVANYLDGHQITKFDELNILSGRTFQNDLASAMGAANKTPVVSREQTIRNDTKRKNNRGRKND